LATHAYEAWRIWSKASQEQVDRVCEKMAEAAYLSAGYLGQLAHEETGYGVAQHKRLKNEFAAEHVWNSIKNIKTVGVVNHNPITRVYEIAWPMGVIAALTPSTNPTSTVIYKILIAIKARDAIVIAPHPSATRCSFTAASLMAKVAEDNGAPNGLISCMQNVSLQGSNELMNHKNVALILATGGTPMVRAAHSMGKPTYGVGPGNVPVYVDRSADLAKAAKYIVASKAFDFSTICATEQAVVADRPIAKQLQALMELEGAFFTDDQQTNKLRDLIFNKDGSMNTSVVGKSAGYIAKLAGLAIPQGTNILVTKLTKTGYEEPLSREKLTTVLGWYVEDGWEAGCERCIELIQFGGRGHSLVIHATDEKVIMAFGMEKPVFRIAVNTMGTLGAIGLTTGVMPSLTLGAGGVGGSITGDNISTYHLFNIKRLAYETSEPPLSVFPRKDDANARFSSQEIEKIVQRVVEDVLHINQK
jgi:acetaldehyde dehydrogenase (acetylating)